MKKAVAKKVSKPAAKPVAKAAAKPVAKSAAKPAAKVAAKPTAKVSTPSFPANELTAWLKDRKSWEHNDWMALLADLRSKGFGTFTDTPEGCASIGLFLESNRSK